MKKHWGGIYGLIILLWLPGLTWGQTVTNPYPIPWSMHSTDGTFAANSDSKHPTEKATTTYIGTVVGAYLPLHSTADASGNLILNPAPANLGYSGTYFTATAGENVAIGDVCYLKSDGKYWLAKADVATTKLPGAVIATGTINANATGIFLQSGFLRNDSWAGWTVGSGGGELFVSITGTTGNTITQTVPSASGNIVQKIGYAYASKIIFFSPNQNQSQVP